MGSSIDASELTINRQIVPEAWIDRPGQVTLPATDLLLVPEYPFIPTDSELALSTKRKLPFVVTTDHNKLESRLVSSVLTLLHDNLIRCRGPFTVVTGGIDLTVSS